MREKNYNKKKKHKSFLGENIFVGFGDTIRNLEIKILQILFDIKKKFNSTSYTNKATLAVKNTLN